MASRIEWVRLRLENWALWKSREAGGGLGFYSQSSFLGDASSERYREAVVPVDDVDAAVTDEAVNALRSERPNLHAVIWAYYVAGTGTKQTARSLGKNESTIRANLVQGDIWLQEWFRTRAQRQRAQRAAWQGGFTS